MIKMQYKMKKHINWALLAIGFVTLFSSYADEPDKFELTGGKPSINYIRLQDAASKDSLLVEAFTATPICIVGENLTSTSPRTPCCSLSLRIFLVATLVKYTW